MGIVRAGDDSCNNASVGSQGDAFDNALAESVIGLYKTEVIRRRGPWRTLEAVEFATLEWVDWFNMRAASMTLRQPDCAFSEATPRC